MPDTPTHEALLEAVDALVVVRRREADKAEVRRQEIGLILGLEPATS